MYSSLINVILLATLPLLISSFQFSANAVRVKQASRAETALHAKITPNQGESMDMYRKVRVEMNQPQKLTSTEISDEYFQ